MSIKNRLTARWFPWQVWPFEIPAGDSGYGPYYCEIVSRHVSRERAAASMHRRPEPAPDFYHRVVDSRWQYLKKAWIPADD